MSNKGRLPASGLGAKRPEIFFIIYIETFTSIINRILYSGKQVDLTYIKSLSRYIFQRHSINFHCFQRVKFIKYEMKQGIKNDPIGIIT
jgi:hypothetical protein